jgi:hypothetical protein
MDSTNTLLVLVFGRFHARLLTRVTLALDGCNFSKVREVAAEQISGVAASVTSVQASGVAV